ncbi:MAG TPA: DUF4240 domain-containing protein [Phototrophicaceae bacterium]|jgi:hypothetical protein|nr:DUF4240 domain-containing protein [Phototrophicaceae bacterium]
MNLDTFWNIIETTHWDSGGDNQTQFDLLVDLLIECSEAVIITFDRVFNMLMDDAYRADVWAAVSFAFNADDESFANFRAWLVVQGREVFESVLNNPDNLADFMPDDLNDLFYESFAAAAPTAYEIKTGTEDAMPASTIPRYFKLVGQSFRPEDYPRVFPRLAAKLSTLNM